jgi:hypothetical protein
MLCSVGEYLPVSVLSVLDLNSLCITPTAAIMH